MSPQDDSPHDMDSDDPTTRPGGASDIGDEDIESLLAGRAEEADDLGPLFAGLRQLRDSQPRVPVFTLLAEFVSETGDLDRPTGVDTPEPLEAGAVVIDSPAASVSPTPRRRHRMLADLAQSTAARVALAGGVTLAGITGVHAAGLVDVPLLPDKDEPVTVAALGEGSEQPDTEATPAQDTADPVAQPEAQPDDGNGAGGMDGASSFSVHFGDGGFRLELGDASISISVEVVDGEAKVDVEAEGLSPECTSALESLEDITDPEALTSAAERIDQACADDLGELFLNPGDLAFDFDGRFGDPGFGMFFDEHFDPEKLEEFLDEWRPEHLQDFLDQFEGFDPEQFGQGGFGFFLDEHFDPEKLQDFLDQFEGFDPEQFGQGGFGFFFDEDFDPENLPELGDLFNGGSGLPFDLGELDRFLEDFDPNQLDRFLEDFDPDQLDRFLEDFDPDQLDDMLRDLEDLFGPLPELDAPDADDTVDA